MLPKPKKIHDDIESYYREQFHYYGYKILSFEITTGGVQWAGSHEQKTELFPSFGELHMLRIRALGDSALR